MKNIVIAAITAITFTASITSTASAGCSSIGNSVYCSDGNSYTTIGNSTYGSNSRTGSFWSQTTIGNSTFGYDSNGSYWSN